MKKLFLFLPLSIFYSNYSAHAAECNQQQLQHVLASATAQSSSVKLNCSLTLPAQAKVSKQIIFEGNESSDIDLDCNGATLDATHAHPSVLIQSLKKANTWSVPSNINIKNCQIYGSLRIHGMASNGEGKQVRESSYREGHTARVQQAAPHHIVLDNLSLYAGERNMMYFAPGVNHITLQNSHFLGKSDALALYLDAESANNTIRNNQFNVQTKTREVIAVDGSASNKINNNTFINPKNGAIFLYRNCGEGGAIRHQSPMNNQIMSNNFQLNTHLKTPLIWLGSRNGGRNYCGADDGYAFGSSSSDLDFAEYNQVLENNIQLKKIKWYEFWIDWFAPQVVKVDSLNNTIANNTVKYR